MAWIVELWPCIIAISSPVSSQSHAPCITRHGTPDVTALHYQTQSFTTFSTTTRMIQDQIRQRNKLITHCHRYQCGYSLLIFYFNYERLSSFFKCTLLRHLSTTYFHNPYIFSPNHSRPFLKHDHAVSTSFNFCRTMLCKCGLCRHLVSVRPSGCLSQFVYFCRDE